MSNNSISLILKHTGVKAAEHQLAVIANEGGDQELAVIVKSLSPGEVTAIIGEGDFTKPSIAVHFITPEQFIGALERQGARWGKLDNRIHADYEAECKQQVADFVLSVVLSSEDKSRREELIKVLLATDFGSRVAILLAINEKECVEFFQDSFEHESIMLGTWQELFVELASFDPSAFRDLKEAIISLYEEQGTDERTLQRYVHKTLKLMSRTAMQHVDANNPTKKTVDEVFSDI